MIEFRIGNKIEELKFNYAAKFKADKLFSSLDADGNSVGNGAAVLWGGLIVNKSDTAIFQSVKAMTDGYTEDEIIEAIGQNAEKAGGVEKLIDQFAAELEQSDFFKHAHVQFEKQQEKLLKILKKKKNKTPEDEENIAQMEMAIEIQK
ncbi:hypothetical protein GNF18_08135 [Ligilactobacillus pobuzihii]|uniref:tail assembly chaperone n=1 Tax=Ligilactobacillus pobuzihii TaxID=449659 RepID=UPI0019D19CB2|nr:tail assembly chaperone [Ligilactobacillus pobuzihii]MBN7275104.1 hypothetical protein [Ligilactobacillus pobuzihii]